MNIYFPRIFFLSRLSLFYVAQLFYALCMHVLKNVWENNKFATKTETNDIICFCFLLFACFSMCSLSTNKIDHHNIEDYIKYKYIFI